MKDIKQKCNKNGEPIIKNDKGQNVFPQEFSTVTHSINLKNLEQLEKLGYIEITNIEDKFNLYQIQDDLGMKKKHVTRTLLAEKIGFSNYEGVKSILKAQFSGNKEEIENNKTQFKRISFRLTDKHFDFKDLYEKINNYKPYDSIEEKNNLKRFRNIFFDGKNRIPGILSGKQSIRNKVKSDDGKTRGTYVISERKKKIDIAYDKFGRPYLNYNAQRSFGEKIEEEYQKVEQQKIENQAREKRETENQEQRNKFLDSIRVNKEYSSQQQSRIQENQRTNGQEEKTFDSM